MAKKFKIWILILAGAPLTLLVVLGIVSRFSEPASIFALVLKIAFCYAIISFVILQWLEGFNLFESINACLLAASLLILFGIFGPVFVDRSISYHIILGCQEGLPIRAQRLLASAPSMYEKRLIELENLSLIKIENQQAEPTPLGRILARIWLAIGYSTSTLHEYETFKKAVKDGSK